MGKEKIILIGGGGHCRSVIDVIETEDRFVIEGIVDQAEKIGTKILSYPIIGSDEQILELCKQYTFFLITLGHIKSASLRIKLYNSIKRAGGNFPVIVSPKAYISRHSEIGEGTVVMHHALINAGSSVGINCIINTGAVIEHDSKVQDHCHVSTGAYINGDCIVGSESFIGSQSVLLQGTVIEKRNIIAAGSVVTRQTEPNAMYAGNPARLKRYHE